MSKEQAKFMVDRVCRNGQLWVYIVAQEQWECWRMMVAQEQWVHCEEMFAALEQSRSQLVKMGVAQEYLLGAVLVQEYLPTMERLTRP